jgi:hypothetical protein
MAPRNLCSGIEGQIRSPKLLREAYDKFVASGKAAAVDKHRAAYLAWINVHV